MPAIILGHPCCDEIIIGDEKSYRPGGPSYFQSHVFEQLGYDFEVMCHSPIDLMDCFAQGGYMWAVTDDAHHVFTNEYPDKDNMDIRIQSTNFPKIPITVDQLKDYLFEGKAIDAFIINPLNPYDFPIDTIEYLKTYDVPIYMSLQGFLRRKENKAVKLAPNKHIAEIVKGADTIFLDENEAQYVPLDELDVGEIVITNGSKGSRILGEDEIKIDAIESDNVVDTTGCGDTFMAAYIISKLEGYTSRQAGNFASMIASEKTRYEGPYKKAYSD